MSHSVEARLYSIGEEIANAMTHGIGALLSVAGLTLLVVFAAMGADPWVMVGVTVFGVTMLIMYLASTLYHALPHPDMKRIMRVADHCAIYLLIAGTYTPFLLVHMRGNWGVPLLVLMWGMALCGCIFKIFTTGKLEKLSTAFYIGMGWVAVAAFKPTVESIPAAALLLMFLGGLAYTSGVIFYHWERLPYSHAIWHCFVMAGTFVHFMAVFFWVLPPLA